MYSYSFLCRRENARRDALGEAGHVSHAFEDMTDKRKPISPDLPAYQVIPLTRTQSPVIQRISPSVTHYSTVTHYSRFLSRSCRSGVFLYGIMRFSVLLDNRKCCTSKDHSNIWDISIHLSVRLCIQLGDFRSNNFSFLEIEVEFCWQLVFFPLRIGNNE